MPDVVFLLVVEFPDVTFTAGCVGLGTPRGFIFPRNVEELIPVIEAHPTVSQYRPDSSAVDI